MCFHLWDMYSKRGIGIGRQMPIETKQGRGLGGYGLSLRCVRDDRVGFEEGAMSDVRGEVKLPDEPASSGLSNGIRRQASSEKCLSCICRYPVESAETGTD